MAITKFLARDLLLEVENEAGTDFVPIGGLTTIAHSPSTSKADATGMDSAGRAENVVTQRGDTWTATGHAKEDVASGARDAGQARVEELGKLVGLDATGTFRITSPGGNRIEFDATVEVTQAAGGHNDLATWQAAIEVSGDVTYTPAAA